MENTENTSAKVHLPMSQTPENPKDKNLIWQFLTRRSTITGLTFISIAFILTSFTFFAAAQWGPEPRNDQNELICKNPPEGVLMCKILNSKLLQQVQNFSVIFAACFFIIETFERNKRKYREAWSLIDGARESETSGARILALKELHEDGEPLKGLDAEKADLIGINLKGAILEKANLRRASLKNSNLEGADLKDSQLQEVNFEEANLQHAKLQGAKMQHANLTKAKLQYANFRAAKLQYADLDNSQLQNAILQGAQLQEAYLGEAQFQKADLEYADFRGADLFRANFEGANIENADFRGTTNLKAEQVVNKAKNWEKAKYGIDFARELGDCLNRQEYSDEWKRQVTEKDEEEDEDFKRLLKLVIASDSIRKKEILRIEEKLNIALELLNGNKPVSVEDTRQVESIVTDVVEDIVRNNFNYSQDAKTKLRKHLQNLKDKSDAAPDEVKQRLEFNIQASEWLRVNCESLKNLGVKKLLINKPEMGEPGAILDSTEKINQLSSDIQQLLELLIESLALHKEKEDVYVSIEGVNIQSSKALCLNVLQIIWEDVIPRILETKKEFFLDGVRNQMDLYLFAVRDKLIQLN